MLQEKKKGAVNAIIRTVNGAVRSVFEVQCCVMPHNLD